MIAATLSPTSPPPLGELSLHDITSNFPGCGESVAAWLANEGLEQYAGSFSEAGYCTFDDLLEEDTACLSALMVDSVGMVRPHARQLLRSISVYKKVRFLRGPQPCSSLRPGALKELTRAQAQVKEAQEVVERCMAELTTVRAELEAKTDSEAALVIQLGRRRQKLATAQFVGAAAQLKFAHVDQLVKRLERAGGASICEIAEAFEQGRLLRLA
jgi:hypothetical protein